jgi:hypothetical protein
MKKIDFCIIAGLKCGSTSLYHYLGQHPDIYLGDTKEIIYFGRNKLYEKGDQFLEKYYDLEKIANAKVVGLTDPGILPNKNTPERIQEYNSNMKFILVLRDPVLRAYSAYSYALINGWEKEKNSFSDDIKLELEGKQREFSYFHYGLYSEHLENWLNFFEKDRFLILTFDDMKNNPESFFDRVFEFLDVDKVTIDTQKKHNVTSEVRSKTLQKLLGDSINIKEVLMEYLPLKVVVFIKNIFNLVWKLNIKKQKKKKITREEYAEVFEYYKDDLKKLKEKYDVSFPEVIFDE